MRKNPILSVRLVNGRIQEGIFPFELSINYLGKKKKIDGCYEIGPLKEKFHIDSQFADYLAPFFNNTIKSSIRNLTNDFTKNYSFKNI